MRLNQIVCDGCGAVIRGTKGSVAIKKANIALNGMVTYFTEDGEYIHITRKANDDLCVCDHNCFKVLVNRRIDEYEHRRKERLMREASENLINNGL